MNNHRLIFNIKDLEFIKENYAGIYILLKSKLKFYNKEQKVWQTESKNDFQELWNRFTFEIGKATSSSGKISAKGQRLQKIWSQA